MTKLSGIKEAQKALDKAVAKVTSGADDLTPERQDALFDALREAAIAIAAIPPVAIEVNVPEPAPKPKPDPAKPAVKPAVAKAVPAKAKK